MRPAIGQTAPARASAWFHRRGPRLRRAALIISATLVASLIAVAFIMGRVCQAAKPALPSSSFFTDLPRVANIAHRGASKSASEHTLAAYELALAEGADVLELDLRATSDGVLVVAHDADLKRTLGIPAVLGHTTFERMAALAGPRTPLRLDDVLRQFATTRFNLELKDEEPAIARSLARSLRELGAEHRVLVASRHQSMLEAFREASEGAIATSASAREVLVFRFCQLMGRSCPTPFAALQIPPLRWLGLTSVGFIAEARARGLAVHYWTIDDPVLQGELIRAGADGIMTNDPGALAALTRQLQEPRQ